MDRRNENPPITCRFLNENDLPNIHAAFQEAFSDYLITFQLTSEQLKRHIVLNGVDISRSVGCFHNERIVGFTLNGFGNWNGRPTVYDAGTGVIPEFRRQGLSRAMFAHLFPMCREQSIEQCLLEVIVGNQKAIDLYEGLGFYPTRILVLMESKKPIKIADGVSAGAVITEIKSPDWTLFRKFWDGETSWQNSIDAISRGSDVKRMLGAFVEGRCVAYIVFSINMGRIAQLAVDPAYRGRGIGSTLLLEVQRVAKDAESIAVINVDESLKDAIRFFENRGFVTILTQYEMLKVLSS